MEDPPRFEPVRADFRDGVRLLVGAAPGAGGYEEELAAEVGSSTLLSMSEDNVRVMFEEAGASKAEYESHLKLVESCKNAPTLPRGKIQLSFGGVKKMGMFRPVFISQLQTNQAYTKDILQVTTRGAPFPSV